MLHAKHSERDETQVVAYRIQTVDVPWMTAYNTFFEDL